MKTTDTSSSYESRNIQFRNITEINKYLLYVLIANLIVIIILSAAISLLDSTSSKEQNPSVCYTKGCLKAAAEILKCINQSVDPCDNFYKFACDGWMAKHPIPMGSLGISSQDLFVKFQENQIKMLIDSPLPDGAPKYWTIMKTFHNTCLNRRHNRLNYTMLKDILKDISPVWPLTSNGKWKENSFNLTNVLVKVAKWGFKNDFIVNINIAPSPQKSKENYIMWKPPKFVIQYYEDNVAEYFKIIKVHASYIDTNITSKIEEVEKMIEFEVSLFKIYSETEQNAQLSEINLKDIQIMIPQVNWMGYFYQLLNFNVTSLQNLYVNTNQLKKVSDLMNKTDTRTIANYLWWRIVQSFPYILKFYSEMDCVEILIKKLSIALTAAYVKFRFPRTRADELVSYILSDVTKEIIRIVKENQVMTPSVKKFAYEKLSETIIGFPFSHQLTKEAIVDQYYENLHLTEDSFFQNVIRIQQWEALRSFALFNKQNKRNDWFNKVVNKISFAGYIPSSNRIDISTTYANLPLYHEDRPNYLNFGAIGSVIAYTFVQVFFPPGNTVDAEGYEKNWWDNLTETNFNEKSVCFIDQYYNLTYPGIGKNVRGKYTFLNDIVDNVGFTAAYNAYVMWEKSLEVKEPLLYTVNYTARQLFWISLASISCTNFHVKYPNADKYSLKFNSSLSMFRILGSLSNNEDFAKDFNCPVGSPMNPANKCRMI